MARRMVHELAADLMALHRGVDPAAALPGYLCEVCLDAPAVALEAAPGGGERGVCAACATGRPAGEEA